MHELKKGQLVVSKAGRDQGRYFIIHQVLADGYVSLVDGSLRKVEKPKRKKAKHLNALGLVATDLVNSETWTNHQVASAIETLLGQKPIESDRTAEEG